MELTIMNTQNSNGELVNNSNQLHRWSKNVGIQQFRIPEYSVKTKKPYTGQNQTHLQTMRRNMNYESHEWGTFLMWKNLDRKIIKGETGVILFHPGVKKTGEIDTNGEEVRKKVRKYFRVFNRDQTEPIKVQN